MRKTNKAGMDSNKNKEREQAFENFSKILIMTMGIIAILLLFPTFSHLTVFSKGEFTYLESIGIIFAYLTLYSTFLLYFSKLIFKLRIKMQFIRYIFYVMTIGVSIFLTLLIIMFIWIRFDVKTHCEDAKYKFGGNCVDALTKQLDDINQGYRSRNSAIWTLGQLGDKKSLYTLKKYYTGKIPKKEQLNETISQYEIQKAIKWCEEGNITSWMYTGF